MAQLRVDAVRRVKKGILQKAVNDLRKQNDGSEDGGGAELEARALVRCLDQFDVLDAYERQAFSARKKAFQRLNQVNG